MKQFTKSIALAGILTALAGTPAVAENSFNPDAEVEISQDELVYKLQFGEVEFASAYGDRTKGLHGTFGKFPPNFETPLHTHTGAYHAVVLKGVMTNPYPGKEIKELGPGSYWYVPAGVPHTTACISDVPCEWFFYSDGKFDFDEM